MYRTNVPMRRAAAFTLIELLVVVAVIGLLMSIMVPSLGKAKQLAKTVTCATNLRSIDQAMQTYASEFQDAILGNAHTSSAFLYNRSFTGFAAGYSEAGNVPNVISGNDWLSPTAQMMGVGFNTGGTHDDRIARFMQFNAFKPFICPENDVLSTFYDQSWASNYPSHRLISYNTALCFQYVNGNGDNSATLDPGYVNLGSYRPLVRYVGNTASKVYMADGGRWWQGGQTLNPDDDVEVLGASPGGLTSDYGPWSGYSRAYVRGGANADGRTATMRHGNRRNNAPLNTFKFNLAFFDGHVEALNGLDGADPSLWVPTGSTVAVSEYIKKQSNPEFTNRYGGNPIIH